MPLVSRPVISSCSFLHGHSCKLTLTCTHRYTCIHTHAGVHRLVRLCTLLYASVCVRASICVGNTCTRMSQLRGTHSHAQTWVGRMSQCRLSLRPAGTPGPLPSEQERTWGPGSPRQGPPGRKPIPGLDWKRLGDAPTCSPRPGKQADQPTRRGPGSHPAALQPGNSEHR